MSARAIVWALPVLLAVMALVPSASAHAPSQSGVSATTAALPAPVHGTVVSCSSTVTCVYAFNTSAGKGWANTTYTSSTSQHFSFQLPGEAKASYNLAYSTYIGSLIGTYTYWTVGNFVGTDVNTGHVVYGTTDTNYTITCHGHSGRGGGCTYTYTTDNGTVVVKFTNAEITSTGLTCNPTTTHPQGKVSCTVKVTNGWNATNYPTGTVYISTGRTGTISPTGGCPLVNGSCSFTYHPSDNACGAVTLIAKYPGNAAFYRSSASIGLDVYVSGGC